MYVLGKVGPCPYWPFLAQRQASRELAQAVVPHACCFAGFGWNLVH